MSKSLYKLIYRHRLCTFMFSITYLIEKHEICLLYLLHMVMLIFSSQLYSTVNSRKKTLTFILNGFSGGAIQIAPSSKGKCQKDAMQNDEE